MRVALVHFSDLFYPSGTAVIYRRVLPRLATAEGGGHALTHFHFNHVSDPDPAAIARRYASELPGITPVDLGGSRWLPAYSQLALRLTGRHLLSGPCLLFAWRLRRALRRLRPDLLWWSADYFHGSLKTLDYLRRVLGDRTRLHLSVYDPPGFWGASDKGLRLYQRALVAASSVDVIGENLRAEVRAALPTPRPVFRLNDFVERPPAPAAPPPDGPRTVVITGQIVGPAELQRLLDLLGADPAGAVLRWLGAPHNHAVADQLRFPANVALSREAAVPRERVAATVRGAHFGYLNMPADQPEFSRFSVPTKLITYLEAGLPVAFHAPASAEVHGLNEEFGFGVNLLTAPDPAAALRELVAARPRFLEGGRRLIAARYDPAEVLAEARRIVEGS